MVLQIILIITTIQYLFSWIFKTSPEYLCCGIWCFVGKQKADPLKLKILALYNQFRGDHATGICINNNVIKDTITAREFGYKHSKDFEVEGELKNHVVLGHCRSATYAYSKENVAYAHPHAVTLDDVDFLRLVHNGTIQNCSDLASKYKTTASNKSDSMLMAEILAMTWNNTEKRVLLDYEGSATLVFYPVNTVDTLYVHRDKDKELYYWKENKDSCYISSMQVSLIAIGAPVLDIKEFEQGILTKFVGGKITKTWNLQNKTPYKVPKVKREWTSVTPSKPVEAKTTTNGFVWNNHQILFNGHGYTGEIYVGKKGQKPEKFVSKYDSHLYDHYYVIMGLIMKDKNAYDTLYKKCTKDHKFNHVEFTSILLSELQPYVMFPILGKTYSDSGDQFFWSDETKSLNKPKELFSWSPPLCNKTFYIDKAGYLKIEETNTPPLSEIENIEYLILDAVHEKRKFKDLNVLYKALVSIYKNEPPTFSSFLSNLSKLFKRSSYVRKSLLAAIDRHEALDSYPDLQNAEEGYNSWQYVELLRDVLAEYMIAVEEEEKNNNADSSVDAYLTEQIADDRSTGESEYYKTPEWKDDILFGSYEAIEDVLQNFLQTEEPEYIKPLFQGLAILFNEIGLMTAEEVVEIKNKSIPSAKHELSRIFNELKEQKAVKFINKLFQDGDITEGFAKLMDEYEVLNGRAGLTEKELLKFTILKTGLKYIQRKATSLDKEKLKKDYNISEEALVELCT